MSTVTEQLHRRETLTVTELAEVLGIGRGTAYQLVRTGRIRSLRIGRRVVIPSSAVRELLGER